MRIFSCHHQAPTRFVNTSLFQTFPLTVDASPLPGLRVHDNRLSEMRHQHYVWKNYRSAETVGFEHYRRVFFLTGDNGARLATEFPDLHELTKTSAQYWTHHFIVNNAVFNRYLDYRESLDAAEIAGIEAFLGSFDIVTTRPELRSMEEMLFFPLDQFGSYLAQTRFFQRAPQLEMSVPHRCHWLNCYVMKRELFDEYMEFAFEALDVFDANMPEGHPNPRFLGHMTERLFTTYLYRKRVMEPHLKVLELPTIWYHADLDPDRPAISHDWRHDIAVAERRGRDGATE